MMPEKKYSRLTPFIQSKDSEKKYICNLNNAFLFNLDYFLIVLEEGNFMIAARPHNLKAIIMRCKDVSEAFYIFECLYKNDALSAEISPTWSVYPPEKEWLNERCQGIPLLLNLPHKYYLKTLIKLNWMNLTIDVDKYCENEAVAKEESSHFRNESYKPGMLEKWDTRLVEV